jgi:hypothetical protein
MKKIMKKYQENLEKPSPQETIKKIDELIQQEGLKMTARKGSNDDPIFFLVNNSGKEIVYIHDIINFENFVEVFLPKIINQDNAQKGYATAAFLTISRDYQKPIAEFEHEFLPDGKLFWNALVEKGLAEKQVLSNERILYVFNKDMQF